MTTLTSRFRCAACFTQWVGALTFAAAAAMLPSQALAVAGSPVGCDGRIFYNGTNNNQNPHQSSMRSFSLTGGSVTLNGNLTQANSVAMAMNSSDGYIYEARTNINRNLYVFDAATNETLLSVTGTDTWDTNPTAAEFDPSGTLYLSGGTQLSKITGVSATSGGTSTSITLSGSGLSFPLSIGDFAWYNNTLWGIDNSTGSPRLISIDTNTGVVTVVASLSGNTTSAAIAGGSSTAYAYMWGSPGGIFARYGRGASSETVAYPLTYIQTAGPNAGLVTPITGIAAPDAGNGIPPYADGAHCANTLIGPSSGSNDFSVTAVVTGGATTYQPGTTVTVTYTVANSGSIGAFGTFSVPLPSDTSASWTCSSTSAGLNTACTPSGTGAVSDPYVQIYPGNSVVYTVTYTILTTAAGTLSTTGTMAANEMFTESSTTNNSAGFSLTQVAPNLSISNWLQNSSGYAAGGTGTYTLEITSTQGAVHGLVLSDILPQGVVLSGQPTCTQTSGTTVAAGVCSGTVATGTSSDGASNALAGLTVNLGNGATTPQAVQIVIPVSFPATASSYGGSSFPATLSNSAAFTLPAGYPSNANACGASTCTSSTLVRNFSTAPAFDTNGTKIAASPATAAADGATASSVTVTLQDLNGAVTIDSVDHTVNFTKSGVGTAGSSCTISAGQSSCSIMVTSTVLGSASFTAMVDSNTVVNGSPATVNFIAGAPSTGANGTKIACSPASLVADNSSTSTCTVILQDALGHVTSDTVAHTVAWVSPLTGSTLTPTSCTIVAGSSSCTVAVKSSKPGSSAITATDNGSAIVNGSPANVAFTAGAPSNGANGNKIACTPTSLVADGTATSTCTATLQDQLGNTATDTVAHTIAWTSPLTGSTLTPGSCSIAAGSSSCTVMVKSTKPGTSAITATDNGTAIANGSPASITFTQAPAPAAPTITVPPLSLVVWPAISGTGTAGLTITVQEAGTTLCTATVAADGSWTCTPSSTGTPGAHTVTATQTNTVTGTVSSPVSGSTKILAKSITGPATGGDATLTIGDEGGALCGIDTTVSGFSATASAGTPDGYRFPYGVVSYTLLGCTPGSTVTVTTQWPGSVASMKYWKFGPKTAGAANAWFEDSAATLSGVTTVAKVTDGGAGDEDGSAQGTIVDPAGPAVEAIADTVPVPAMDWRGLLATMLLLAALGGVAVRQRHR